MSDRNVNRLTEGTRPSRTIVSSYDTGYEHSLQHYAGVKEIVEQAESGKVAIACIYRDRGAVDSAADALLEAGIQHSGMSVLFLENEGMKDFACGKHTNASQSPGSAVVAAVDASRSLRWRAQGETLAIDGTGPCIVAGPIVAALAGAVAEGIFDGIAGALVGMGIPRHEAKRYEGQVKEGGILVSVHVVNSDSIVRAKDILERTGASQISSTSGESAEWRKSGKSLPRAS